MIGDGRQKTYVGARAAQQGHPALCELQEMLGRVLNYSRVRLKIAATSLQCRDYVRI